MRLCAPFECYNGGEMVYSSAGRLDICFKDFKLHVNIGNILYIHTYIHIGLIDILLKDIFSLRSQPTVVLV